MMFVKNKFCGIWIFDKKQKTKIENPLRIYIYIYISIFKKTRIYLSIFEEPKSKSTPGTAPAGVS